MCKISVDCFRRLRESLKRKIQRLFKLCVMTLCRRAVTVRPDRYNSYKCLIRQCK